MGRVLARTRARIEPPARIAQIGSGGFFSLSASLRALRGFTHNKGKGVGVREVAIETIDEGLCVQMLHVGPYDREGDTIAIMQACATEQGLEFRGPHHEIYLSDPRRVAPERLRTILREPVVAKG